MGEDAADGKTGRGSVGELPGFHLLRPLAPVLVQQHAAGDGVEERRRRCLLAQRLDVVLPADGRHGVGGDVPHLDGQELRKEGGVTRKSR